MATDIFFWFILALSALIMAVLLIVGRAERAHQAEIDRLLRAVRAAERAISRTTAEERTAPPDDAERTRPSSTGFDQRH